MTVEHELHTLRRLHAVLGRAAHDLEQVADGLDEAVTVELWAGAQADRLRGTWRGQRQVVEEALLETVRTSVSDVRTQHNNLAVATGQPDRL